MSTQHTNSSPHIPNHKTCFDPQEPLDIDSFIDYDQVGYPTPSIPPSASYHSHSKSQQSSSLVDTRSPLPLSSQSSTQQIYSGPSHQYDDYKQQTGLPVGALANTFAINEANNVQFIPNQIDFGFSNDHLFGLGSSDDLDFGSAASGSNMDFETPPREDLPAFFYPSQQSPSSSAFIDPVVVGGQEESKSQSDSVPEIPTQSNAGRLWPGMHQQQALAKAQAEAGQRKLKHQEETGNQHPSRARKAAAQRQNDPIADEKISQLLNSMRHSSVTSSVDEDANISNVNGALSHITRMRKDEEDMDEDERLLASEEGKKLSSKERRQLRNKVSARAFRSRRKEYIGQLEGELAAKANEMDLLKNQNRALMDENSKLTDLTRMLLSSPAFSTFLDDMTASGLHGSSISVAEEPSSGQIESNQPTAPKDVSNFNRSQVQAQQSQQSGAHHIGMALMPDTQIDFSTLDVNNNPWDSRHVPWVTNQPQVFSVLDVPTGPAVDTGILSGKVSNSVGPCFANEDCKDERPTLDIMPSVAKDEGNDGCESHSQLTNDAFDESDPSFALYADSFSSSNSTFHRTCEQLLREIDVEKTFTQLHLVCTDEVVTDEISLITMARFEQICSSMDVAFERVAKMTSHL